MPMDKTSTTFDKKSVKQEKPSRRVIANILNYSKSIAMVSGVYGRSVLLINN
ncbi:MAG: hypothetical protein MJZ46_01015 [Bacteroidales bacterium]|nr:hypothetical protein [Bacteroidales bacterium]